MLHVSPHPDDEVLGAGATLTLLRDAGCRVVNLACSLGRPEQHDRRHRELSVAIQRLGVELRLCAPPLAISSSDDLAAAERQLVEDLRALDAELRIGLVVSPQPTDGHHGHEVVGRAVRRWLAEGERSIPWWVWGLWADLSSPTLFVPFDGDRFEMIAHALDAHEGELARNDYRRLLKARAVTSAVLGSERTFGFGSPAASPLPYAEVFVESTYTPERRFRRCAPRVWTGDGADLVAISA